MNEQSQQPPPTEAPVVLETKQKCMVCDALLAKTFIDLNSRRVHLCYMDAFTILRMACNRHPEELECTLEFVNSQIYGRE